MNLIISTFYEWQTVKNIIALLYNLLRIMRQCIGDFLDFCLFGFASSVRTKYKKLESFTM